VLLLGTYRVIGLHFNNRDWPGAPALPIKGIRGPGHGQHVSIDQKRSFALRDKNFIVHFSSQEGWAAKLTVFRSPQRPFFLPF